MKTVMAEDLAALRASMREREGGPVIDVAAWVGEYPFRRIPGGETVDHLRAKMAALGVERAIVSDFHCVFAENNLDAYEAVARGLENDAAVEVWPVVRPGMLWGLEKVLDRYRPRGLRLVPNYHGYRLSDVGVSDVMRIARERGMVVQVFQRLADERWHWMVKVAGVELTDLEYLTAVYGGQTILVSGLQPVGGLAARMRQSERLFVDVSRVRGPQFAVEQLVKAVPAGRVVFGSLWPVQIVEATLWQVTTARVEEGVRAGILRGNARRMLGA